MHLFFTHHLTFTAYIDTDTRTKVLASAGNNGSVQLWLDGKKLANGHCQCHLFNLCFLSALTLSRYVSQGPI